MCVGAIWLENHRKPEPSDVDRAILSLKTQRRKLGEYQRQVQNKIVAAHAKAQACIKEKNKTRAMFNLKQKKIFEVRLGEIEQYLVNVEETLVNIDTARQNNKVFEALRVGNDALKTIQAKVSIGALQDLMADTAQAKEHEDEVNSILSEENIDMSEVEGELTMLEEEIFQETVEDQLPDVPTTKLEAAEAMPKPQQEALDKAPVKAEEPMLA